MRAEDGRLGYDLLHTDGNETFALRARHTAGTLCLLGDSYVWGTWITVDGLLVIHVLLAAYFTSKESKYAPFYVPRSLSGGSLFIFRIINTTELGSSRFDYTYNT